MWKLDVNLKRTKVVPISVEAGPRHEGDHFGIDRGEVDHVTQYEYLGYMSSVGLTLQPEICQRLAKVGSAFHRLSKCGEASTCPGK